ncbi:MAG: carbohydrate-binding domain-containing protein [Prevotella sp.]|nr:carbohydrate-binding domain-containing protein [Prevotella sp.]
MNKILNTTLAAILFCTAASAADIIVKVEYNGNSAVVTIPTEASAYVNNLNGESSHVKLLQTSTTEKNPGEIIYSLSGQSDNGEFYLTGEYKATLQLNGLTLTNPDSTAIHIKDGKRIKVSMAANTVNTLKDGVNDSTSKGCFHCKGHTEFVGKGTLNVSSSFNHAIYSKEYVEVKNCTINVTGAKKDGIHCQEYCLISSGEVNISGVEDDGIQVELKDSVATGQTLNHEDENSGNFYMTGGTLNINDLGSYCIKAYGSITFTGGKQNFDTSNIKDHDTTAINDIVSSKSGNRQYYDLNGRRMPNDAILPRGIYIVKEGDKTRKIVVK